MTTPTLNIEVPNAPTIDMSNWTQGIQSGVGVFDVMMRGVLAQTEKLLNDNFISKTEYANIILQVIPAVLQQTSAYALAKEKQGYEIALLIKQYEIAEQERLNQVQQGVLLQAQIEGQGIQNEVLQYTLDTKLPAELAQIEAQTDRVLVDTDIATYTLATKLPAEVAQLTAQTTNLSKQGTILDKDSIVKDKEILLAEAQIDSQTAQTALYEQKTVTELAQTNSTAIGSGSVIDKQNKVLDEQAKAFLIEAKLKLTKLYTDVFIVRTQNDDLVSANNINLLNDKNVGAVVTEVFGDLGITPVTT